MKAKMKLYYAAPSPFARKVRVLIRELGIADSIEEVTVHTTPTARDAGLTLVNPLSKIPTLITVDGEALFDSRVILDYLTALAPASGTPSFDAPPQWKSLRRHALADGILDAGLLQRYELVLRPADLRWPAWLEAQHGKILQGLSALASDPPVESETIGLDAIAAACALGWLEFRMPELEWKSEHPSLSTFFLAMSKRRSMLETKPDP